jgi:hypothetical protein
MNGERALVLVYATSLTSMPVVSSYFKLDAAHGMEVCTQWRDACALADYPAAIAASAALRNAPKPRFPGPVSSIARGFDRMPIVEFRARCERRMAAIALAIRLYRIDHSDAWPVTLDELVPNYLQSLPADPFRADGKTFGYVASLTQPLIYSVGENGTDEGASTQPTARHLSEERDFMRWDRQDAVLYLTRLPKPPPLSDQD